MAVIQPHDALSQMQSHLGLIQGKCLLGNRVYITKRDEVIDFIPPN